MALLVYRVNTFSVRCVTGCLVPGVSMEYGLCVLIYALYSFLDSVTYVLLFVLVASGGIILNMTVFSVVRKVVSAVPIKTRGVFVDELGNGCGGVVSKTLNLISLSYHITSVSILKIVSMLPNGVPIAACVFVSTVTYMLYNYLFLV